jgi:uncharacterized protein (TIGR03437 family)
VHLAGQQAPTPAINAGGTVNGASFRAGAAVAPGSIASVFGSFLVSSPSGASSLPLPTSLSGLSMQFGSGVKAPLFYASAGQVNLQVPWELAGQAQASLTATLGGQTSAAQTVNLAPFAPGIFSTNAQGTGQGAIQDASSRLVDSSNPAAAGSTVIIIYCTGLGPVTNRPASGSWAPINPLAETTTKPTVTIGGVPATVQFSGLVPGFVGLYQVNAVVPAGTPAGDAVPVVLSIGGATSNTVTIAVKPTVGGAASLTSVNPNSASAGQVFTVVLTGTNFVQGQTLANFGPGISVAGAAEGQPGVLTVASPTSATARLTINPLAVTGARTVTVTSGAQTVSLNNAFTVLAVPAPMGPLTVTSTSPANGATGVSLRPTIQIVFNEPLDPATVGSTTSTLANGSTLLPATVAYDSTRNLVTLTPGGVLRPQTTYTVTVSALVRNLAESPLGAPYTFSFTTIPPASVSGSITPASGLDPTTLTVVSFAGKTTTPTSSGSFSATLDPQGTGLVAAMFPRKSFGLLAMTIGGMRASSNSARSDFKGPAASIESAPATASRVHTTQWQVTASATAATSSNSLVADFQTTAEALVFISPYLLTSDPRRAAAILSAIAGNAATAQLAQVLARRWSEADPLSDPAVQSARQSAVQAAVQFLVSQGSAPQTSAQGGAANPEIYGAEAAPSSSEAGGASSTSWSPATAAVSPYCWDRPNHTASVSGLQCLDLEYVSFPSGAIAVDQNTGKYIFSPQNCTGSLFLLGCAVGWLGRVTPVPASSDGGNPESIVAGGPGAFGPQSPVGAYDSASCGSSAPCATVWLDGSSSLQYLDLKGDLIKAVSLVVQHLSAGNPAPDGPSFSLPAPAQLETDYIVRFYSGGIADAGELSHVFGSSYSNGQTLFLAALGVNAMESAFNVIDALNIMPSGVMSCALEGTAQLLVRGAVTASAAPTRANLESAFKTVFDGATGQVASCAGQDILGSALQILRNVFTWGTGVGTVLNALSAVSNLGQAVQRVTELAIAASPVETAVIAIRPGSAVVGNPIPSIKSLSPASATAGGASLLVTINGTGFVPGSTVTFNGKPHAASFLNSGQLTITLSASDLSTAGTLPVVVTNPAPGGGSSLPANFTVTPAPVTTGTIQVTTNLTGATFTISGPANYSGSGTTWTKTNAPVGGYTITFGAVSGYTTPPAQTKTLTAGGTITFTGSYSKSPPGGITITEFPVPTAYSQPVGITAGPDGNLWFTEFTGNKIGRITPSGTITEFPVPTVSSRPHGITAGPDGNLWFTELDGNKIGRITPAGTMTEFPVPPAYGYPVGITAGPDGNLWFTGWYGSKIGRITPSGTITEFPVPTVSSRPYGITAGPDGNLWFTEYYGNKIGRITPSGTITEFLVPTANSYPAGITGGPDGNLWFTEDYGNGNTIGRITPSGTITEFPVPTAYCSPEGITAGPDGNLWFVEVSGNKIGRITPTGTITEFPVPTAYSNPWGITAGPDGNLWFTEFSFTVNKIGRIVISPASP